MKKIISTLFLSIFIIALFANNNEAIALPKTKNLKPINNQIPTIRNSTELKSVNSETLKNATLKINNSEQISDTEAKLNEVTQISTPPSIQNIQGNIVDYYEGIEKTPTKLALYSLISKQNEDGSFGSIHQIINTWEYIKALKKFNLTANDQYNNALNFLSNSSPKNNREKAIKIQALKKQNQNYDTLLTEVINDKNTDWGYGFATNYLSDYLTTLEVMNMLNAISYSNIDYINNAAGFLLNKVQPDGIIKFANGQNASYYLINRTLEDFYPFKDNSDVLNKINSMLTYLANNYDESTGILNNTDSLLDYAMTSYSFKIYNSNSSKEEQLKKDLISFQSAEGLFSEDDHLLTFASMKALSQADLRIDSIASTGTLENYATASFNISFTNIGTAELDQFDIQGFLDNVYLINLNGIKLTDGTNFKPNTSYNTPFNYSNTAGCIGNTELKIFLNYQNDPDFDNNSGTKSFNFASATDGRAALPLYHTMFKSEWENTPGATIKWDYVIKSNPNLNSYYLAYKTPSESSFQYIALSEGGDIIFGFPEGSFYNLKLCSHSNNGWLSCYNSLTLHLSSDPNLYTGTVNGYLTEKNTPISNINVEIYETWQNKTNEDGTFSIEKVSNGRNIAYAYHPAFKKILTQFIAAENNTIQNLHVFTELEPDIAPPSIEGIGITNTSIVSAKNHQEVLFTATASDDKGIKEADFYFWDPNDQSWTLLGTTYENTNNKLKYIIFIDPKYEGTGYKIKITARDFQNNETIKESPIFTFTDGKPIDPILNFAGQIKTQEASGKKYVYLTWDKANNTDNDFSHYNVYRTENTHITDLSILEPHQIIEDILTTSLSDTKQLEELRDYYYAIAAVDTNGNIENLIFQESDPYYLDNPLYVELESFEAIRTDNIANITWITTAEIDNNYFNLWRSNGENENYEKINKEVIIARGNIYMNTEYNYQDSGLNPDKDYYYKLEDVDIYGNVDFKGPFKALYPELIITINSFKTVLTSSALSIVWQSEKEQSVEEFNILRATIERGVYKKINSTRILPKGAGIYKYMDSTAKNGIKYFYKLEVLGKNSEEADLFGPISGRRTVR